MGRRSRTQGKIRVVGATNLPVRPTPWERELLAPLAQRFLEDLLDEADPCDNGADDGAPESNEE